MRNCEVGNRQFTSADILVLTVDGSDVAADYSSDGLDCGQHVAEIKKSGAVFSIRFNKSFGRVPQMLAQPITLDCQVRKTTGVAWGKRDIEVTTYGLAGGAGSGNEDFTLFIFGTEGIVEGGR